MNGMLRLRLRAAGRAVVVVRHMLAELERVDRAVEIRWLDPQVSEEVPA